MSRNVRARSPRPDRRVERTRKDVIEAFLTLVVEKGFEALTVRDIIDRANVGRSTFYAHFPDKDALLLFGLDRLRAELENASVDSGFLGLTRQLFAHALGHGPLFRAISGRESGMFVYKRVQRMLTELVLRELRGGAPVQAVPSRTLDLTSRMVVGALLAALTFRLEQTGAASEGDPEEIVRNVLAPLMTPRIVSGG